MVLLRFLCAVLCWVLLYDLAKGEVCGVPEDVDNSAKFFCPKLCLGSQCTSHVMQSYTATDMSSSICGCVGEGFFTPMGYYEESHIIYSKITNISNNKFYLTISEDATRSHSLSSNITRIYNFFLLTTSPAVWIVSYQKSDAQYNFYVNPQGNNGKSLVQDYYTNKDIASPEMKIKIATKTRRRLSFPQQVAIEYCKTFQPGLDTAPCQDDYVTSLLKLNGANSLKIDVGTIPRSNDMRRSCSIPDSCPEFNPRTKRIQAYATSAVLPATSTCSRENVLQETNNLYVVQLANSNRNSTVKLRLFGASLLQRNFSVLMALRSKVPVKWEAIEANNYSIVASLTFMVSSESNVDVSALQASSVRVITSNLLNEQNDTQMLKDLSAKFSRPVKAYTKFTGKANVVNLKLVENSSIGAGAVLKPKESFYAELVQNFSISSSRGAILFISCEALKLYRLKASDIKIGDGSCSFKSTQNGIQYQNLSRCGLRRTSYEDFKIAVTVNEDSDTNEEIRFLMEPHQDAPAMTVFADIMREDPIAQHHVVTRSQSTFFTKIVFPTFEKYGISSKLDHCYLKQNETYLCSLIQENCPVDDYTSFLVHKGQGNTGFSFSLAPLFDDKLAGTVDLVCDVSKCFLPHPNLTWSSALPKCPPERTSACEKRSLPLSTDLDLSVKSVSASFTLGTVQSTPTVWTSTGKTTDRVTPCIAQIEPTCHTWIFVFSFSFVVVVLLVLILICRKPIFAHFSRKQMSSAGTNRRLPYSNHSDSVAMRSDQCNTLLHTRSPSFSNIYEENINSSCDSVACIKKCPLLSSEQNVDEAPSPASVPTRSKEDSTSSSSSSDSGVGERKSLNESVIDGPPLRESNV